MGLELKILKEKVHEDEQKSGIGSIYDDERNMHAHINLLKTKYQKMRRDNERALEELRKRQLHVQNEQHQLEAQLNIIDKQTNTVIEEGIVFKDKSNKEQTLMNKDNKVKSNETRELQNEVEMLKKQRDQAEALRKKNHMRIDDDEKAEAERARRHEEEVELLNKLKVKKNAEKVDLDAKLKKVADDFLAMSDL